MEISNNPIKIANVTTAMVLESPVDLIPVPNREFGNGVGSSIFGVGREKGVGWAPRAVRVDVSASPEGRTISRMEVVGSNSIQPLSGKYTCGQA
jgi:hypothetical protein